jgi:hypothetical protein
MRKRVIYILLVMVLLVSSVLPVSLAGAASKAAQSDYSVGDSQPTRVVLKGGYLSTFVGYTEDGSPEYQVDFGVPTYCDDLITPIDTQWYEQKDGSYKSGDNKYSSDVNAEKIKVAKDKEYIEWSPVLSLAGADKGADLKLNVQNAKPEILDIDPLNENYQKNTLVWHYDNGIDRFFRLIEGQCQEYYVISQPLEYDLVIVPHATQTENFDAYQKAVAYDALDTCIQLSEDSDKIVTLKASSAKESRISDDEELRRTQRTAIALDQEPEVRYPITIDPNYTFTTSASDGNLIGYGSTYSTVRTKTSADYVDRDLDDLWLGQIRESNPTYYEIDRVALFFDTSALDAGDTITGATLNLYSQSNLSSRDFDVQIQNGQPTYPHDPLVASDYKYSRYSGDGGSINTSDWENNEYNPIDLNATGLSWINIDGTTKLMLRSSRDINGNTPTTTDELVVFSSYEEGIGEQPQLIVTYSTHRNWGTKIKDSTTITGIYAMQSFHDNYSVPSSDATLFAPTAKAPNKCSLEVSTSYFYNNGYQRQIGVHNFQDEVWTIKSGDDVDPYISQGYYFVQVSFGLDNMWNAELFNFVTNEWESITKEYSLTSGGDYGWDIFEEYQFSEIPWPSLGKVFESASFLVYDGTWVECTSTYGEDTTYDNMGTADYSREYDDDFWHWFVQDP